MHDDVRPRDDAGDVRSMHGRGKKAALPKFCTMTCAAEASSGDLRISPLAPSNYRRTCEAVQNLVTALAGAANYGELARRARQLKVLSGELLEALEEAHPELDFEPDGEFRDLGPGQLAKMMAVASKRLDKKLVEIKKRAEQDSESEDDSEQPEFEGNDDDDDSDDDDDAPAPWPAAPMEESSSDDDDEQMAPAPAPAPPRAPKKPARKRPRAGSPPARAAAPKLSPGKDLFRRKQDQMRRRRRGD